MLDKIIIHPNNEFLAEADMGLLAESLLFYENVTLIANSGVIAHIYKTIGSENFIKLLEESNLNIIFLRDFFATQTVNGKHDFIDARLATNKLGALPDPIDMLYRIFMGETGKEGKSRRLARRFSNKIQFNTIQDLAPDISIPDLARNKVKTGSLSTEYVKSLILKACPLYPKDISFNIKNTGKSFDIETNIDFNFINTHLLSTNRAPISEATFLSYFHTAIAEYVIISHLRGDLLTKPIASKIIQNEITENLIKIDPTLADIALFQDKTILNGKHLRKIINQSPVDTFSNFMDLLKRADRFKKWISGKPESADLLQEYIKEISNQPWINTFPVKSFRFILSTVIDTALFQGLPAAGAIDAFLIDSIGSWRPNFFITNDLEKFLNK